MSENELCALPLTTICDVPAVSVKLIANGLPPLLLATTTPSGPYTVTDNGMIFEYVRTNDPGPLPPVIANVRDGFLLVTAPLIVVDKIATPGDDVAVGLGLGLSVGAGAGVGLAVGAAVIVGAGGAGVPSARSVAYASTRPYPTGAPVFTALASSAASTRVFVAPAEYESASPAMPATAGVAADVPQKDPYQPARPVV